MARKTRSESMFFVHLGRETRRVYWRINAQAIRFQQGGKEAVTDTLGGAYRDVFFSESSQHNGLMVPDITIEGTTGVAYRKELEEMQWIWQHKADRRPDGLPAETLFYDLVEVGAYQKIERDVQRAWRVSLQNFAWDESVQSQNELKFTFRCKLLEDLLSNLPPNAPPEATGTIPNISDFAANTDMSEFVNPLTSQPIQAFSTTALPL